MNGEEQLRNVEAQVVLITRGQCTAISCPYCGAITPKGVPICCTLMGKAMEAVLDRMDFEDKRRQAEEIAERIDKEPPLVTLN
jgi:hypothetical protein